MDPATAVVIVVLTVAVLFVILLMTIVHYGKKILAGITRPLVSRRPRRSR